MRRILLPLVLMLSACASREPERPAAMPVVHMPWVPRRFAIREPRPAFGGSAMDPAKPSTSVAPTGSGEVVPDGGVVDEPGDAAPTEASDAATTSLLFRSSTLRAPSLRNPMPGGVFAGYAGDTGLDIVGAPRTVYAIADAKVDYAEKGHTRWTGPKDSPYCVRLTLDHPIAWKGHVITHAYYAHLSGIAFEQREGVKERRHVVAGEALGTSGSARGVPHLHLGLLLDSEVEQDDWAFILREGEVRAVLGGYANGETLPKT